MDIKDIKMHAMRLLSKVGVESANGRNKYISGVSRRTLLSGGFSFVGMTFMTTLFAPLVGRSAKRTTQQIGDNGFIVSSSLIPGSSTRHSKQTDHVESIEYMDEDSYVDNLAGGVPSLGEEIGIASTMPEALQLPDFVKPDVNSISFEKDLGALTKVVDAHKREFGNGIAMMMTDIPVPSAKPESIDPKPKKVAKKSSSSSYKFSSNHNNNYDHWGTKRLKIHNVNTGEDVSVTFKKNGKYDYTALKKLDKVFRDRRTGERSKIDPSLYDRLHDVVMRAGNNSTKINLISGYRSPKTNAMLRKRSRGVASISYHTRGMAVDFNLSNVNLSEVHKMALSQKGGGVGYYPGSNFIHIDTGPVRNWPSKYRYLANKYS